MHEAQVDSRINSIGIYFASLKENNARLSIEGAQLVHKSATTNTIKISNEQAHAWIRGKNLEISTDVYGYQIVVNNGDVMGCGYAKEGTLLNYVPKTRRIHAA